ncbi:PH domain-containing protein [Candidatus Saccharibacteria bacterium]|nr:PH domain-containing protein [Candidatus Saccharibacteria bacterium]
MSGKLRQKMVRLNKMNPFSRGEAAEIQRLLLPDETVIGMVGGYYNAGMATICATSKRLLLVDKKWLRMSYEDIRYKSINEVEFSQQGFLASVHFYYTGRDLHFRSWYRSELRSLSQYIQGQMFADGSRKDVLGSVLKNNKMASGVVAGELHHDYVRSRAERWKRATEFIESLALVQRAQARR